MLYLRGGNRGMGKRLIILLLALSSLSCSAVATKYVYSQNGKRKPVERYTCNGTGCKVAFSSGGSMEGGAFIPELPNLKMEN